ncbi:Peroxisomal acyl-coenzyme A oxidase 3 [Blattella germanica]|nr:Peroxisomal acyl-coenzyme A oxidase 3 [Blattella germanica]
MLLRPLQIKILKQTHLQSTLSILRNCSNSEMNPTKEELMPDFPPGPLDMYRKKASFDWRKLKLCLEDEELIRYKMKIWKTLESDPLFHHPETRLTLDEERHLAVRRMYRLKEYNFLPFDEMANDIRKPFAMNSAIFQYCPSLAVKFFLTFNMFANTTLALGTGRHYKYFEGIEEGNAAKCWVGSLGKCATHSIVYAMLKMQDGSNHGLHAFVVPIRNVSTLLPFPGVIIGDLGEKVALNGVDNGFVMFQNYRIPRENLLNKTGNVRASFGALSAGRVTIIGICLSYLHKAIPITIRYSAARKQFGPEDNVEYPVLEYQLQQSRVLPHLASTYALKIFSDYFNQVLGDFQMKMLTGQKSDDMADLGIEIHVLSSAGKPLAAWIARDAIQDCRESCGGHGYLKGENNVLLQQTSNWLVQVWNNLVQKRETQISSPLGSVNFLLNGDQILKTKFTARSPQEAVHPEALLSAYKWLVCWLLQATSAKIQSLIRSGKNAFDAKNDSQYFFAKTLSLAYAEKHLATLYEGGYAVGPEPSAFIKEGILDLFTKLKPDAVSLADVLAPPDFIIHSVLGLSDGKVYENLQSYLFQSPNVFARPSWWNDVVHWRRNSKL